MKNLIFILLVVFMLSMTGLVQAQQAVDPMAGPEVWVTSVYNNSGTALSSGDIVVWNISSSTGDNDNYITTTTTEDTVLVAGIVYPESIGIGKTGSIAVRATGIKINKKEHVGTGGEICTGTVAGKAQLCSEVGDPNRIGFCTADDSADGCIAYISNL